LKDYSITSNSTHQQVFPSILVQGMIHLPLNLISKLWPYCNPTCIFQYRVIRKLLIGTGIGVPVLLAYLVADGFPEPAARRTLADWRCSYSVPRRCPSPTSCIQQPSNNLCSLKFSAIDISSPALITAAATHQRVFPSILVQGMIHLPLNLISKL
jgi:hypothetical protein